MGAVLTTVDDVIGVITINSGKVNALSKELINDIAAAFESIASSALRVMILRAAPGVKIFSAGHDVKELPTNGRDPLTYNDPLRQIVRAIELCPHPVIAMIEGSVWGGACELVFGCDIIVAAEDSTFALTPSKLGVPYNVSGALNFLKVTDLHLLKEFFFTAEPMPASRLAQTGVINHVCSRAELEPLTMRMARQICKNSPLVNSVLKEAIRVLANASPLTAETYERLQSMRRDVYDSEDYQEGINAFFSRRPPQFAGK